MVKEGWSPEYVLNMDIPVFNDYLKAVQWNAMSSRTGEFADTVSAIGTAFSKDAKVENYTKALMDTVKG